MEENSKEDKKIIVDPEHERDLQEMFESDLESITGGYPKPTNTIQNKELDEMFESDLESIHAGYPNPEELDENRTK